LIDYEAVEARPSFELNADQSANNSSFQSFKIGVTGFEPATSSSQSDCTQCDYERESLIFKSLSRLVTISIVVMNYRKLSVDFKDQW
jgi:hypothetical protein